MKYAEVQQLESQLWGKVFNSFEISPDALLTWDTSSPDNPNCNQLFYWGGSSGPNSELIQKASEYFETKKVNGFWRSVEKDRDTEEVLNETYMISTGSFDKAKADRKISFRYFESLEGEEIFLKIFCRSFSLDDSFKDSFEDRMTNIAEKIPSSRFFMASVEGNPVAVGGLFPVSGYDFLMNFGVEPKYQGQGLGKRVIGRIISDNQNPIIFRTSNEAIIKSMAPYCGFEEVACSWVYPMPKKSV